jgi:hypothetical protein
VKQFVFGHLQCCWRLSFAFVLWCGALERLSASAGALCLRAQAKTVKNQLEKNCATTTLFSELSTQPLVQSAAREASTRSHPNNRVSVRAPSLLTSFWIATPAQSQRVPSALLVAVQHKQALARTQPGRKLKHTPCSVSPKTRPTLQINKVAAAEQLDVRQNHYT